MQKQLWQTENDVIEIFTSGTGKYTTWDPDVKQYEFYVFSNKTNSFLLKRKISKNFKEDNPSILANSPC